MIFLYISLYVVFGIIFETIAFIAERKEEGIPDGAKATHQELFLFMFGLIVWPIHMILFFASGWRATL